MSIIHDISSDKNVFMTKKLISISIFICIFVFMKAANDGDNELLITEKKEQTNSYISKINKSLNILYDSASIWWSDRSVISDSIANLSAPAYPAMVYEQRINYLNELTPIRLNYNEHVQVYIEAYGERNRDKMELVMEKSMYYFPILKNI